MYEIPLGELPYEALSYVWGPEMPQRSIIMNDKDLNIRENLWLALHHLRLESEIRVLWIDAICIDQLNIDERNHQVAHMGMIYNRASRVIVWLESSDESSLLAFCSLNPGEWTGIFNPSMLMEGNKKLNAIYSLLTREYWKRLWIIQEFLMARDFVIQCGDESCPRLRISWFMSWIDSIHPIIPERAVIISRILKSLLARLLSEGLYSSHTVTRRWAIYSANSLNRMS
jgi:hypothetical protein